MGAVRYNKYIQARGERAGSLQCEYRRPAALAVEESVKKMIETTAILKVKCMYIHFTFRMLTNP